MYGTVLGRVILHLQIFSSVSVYNVGAPGLPLSAQRNADDD
jgi:hypothetical protein